MPTVLHPTAGYIPDLGGGASPGLLVGRDRAVLRRLAAHARELAAKPIMADRRALWFLHNDLAPVRPMLLVFPEDSWIEVIPAERLEVSDPFWRQWESYLRQLAWRHEHLADDFVIEPEVALFKLINRTGWGLEARYTRGGPKGSYVWEAPMRRIEDLDRLRQPTVSVDVAGTSRVVEALSEAVGDILPVRACCPVPSANLVGEATMLRGLQQVMLDLYDQPELVHRLMAFLSRAILAEVDTLESGGHLTLNNRGHYTDSGGIGFTRELPAGGEERVCARDLWVHGVAQELAGVSPEQHEEFVLQYQLPILERFGLVAYGCCEPYTRKFGMLKRRVPRLRRVSVSPWCGIKEAVAGLEDRYIFSWKPNPALIADGFDADEVRRTIRSTLELAHGCVVEVILKDTFTVQGDASRLERWSRIAREEVERASG